VRHLAPFPDVAVQPQAAVHRVNHPGATGAKFSILRALGQRLLLPLQSGHFCTTAVCSNTLISCDYWQAGTPSTLAGVGVGETAP
jgi:hypothetical protein